MKLQANMTPEVVRLIDKVIPFRLRLLRNGSLISLSVLHNCLNEIAQEFGASDGAVCRTATMPAQPAASEPSSGERASIERMVHDFPALSEFYAKHALGPMMPPSCLCCGQQTNPITRPVAVKHMELPGIVICKHCRDAALLSRDARTAGQAEPVALSAEQTELLNFLLGASDIEGVWFGDKHPAHKGQFWWREKLRQLFAAPTSAQPAPQAAPEWEMPDEPELFKFINETPILQSLLYDVNLLPEQIQDPVRWGYLVSLVSHYEMAVINAKQLGQEQAAPGAVVEGWQPIETAPKDMAARIYRVNGYAIQGFVDAAGIYNVQNERGEWRKMRGIPTHWMPLPAAPSAPKPQGE